MMRAMTATMDQSGASGLPSVVLRFGPLALVVLLSLLNLYLLLVSLKQPEVKLWTGPLMTGKVLPLQVKSAEMAGKDTKQEHSPAAETHQKKEKVVEKPPAAQLHAVSKPVVAHPETKKPTSTPAVAAAPEPVAAVGTAPDGSGYYVQAGSFSLRKGADSLSARLQTRGLRPRTLHQTDMVLVNNVQAGPYRVFAEAKEAEIKLRSAGIMAKTDNTWEGYIISISRDVQLGGAIDSMGHAEKLGVRPLRVIKVEDALKFYKVILGPYKTEKDAKEMSATLAESGLAVPLIKKWEGSGEMAQKDSEG
ncbi:MAG: SPOR domain-containing protein [Magnetococcales bacterium]|nr:SPOR domain-containing protein [Magnetococcales bacterium]MBF0323098.1 SPOR domain-containing protein [Magnetococcales bacterium]